MVSSRLTSGLSAMSIRRYWPGLLWRSTPLSVGSEARVTRSFIHKMFQKLTLNFTWWVNRKDEGGTNLFGGGFLGLDNIGVFDRSAPLPTGGYIEQSDGTSWMAMFCIYMIDMALELSKEDPAYEDIFLKYVYHFMYITSAMQNIGEEHISLWDQQDEFFYDVLRFPFHASLLLKVR